MIRLHRSNRIEVLARGLAAEVARRRSPFEPVTIVIPHRSLERWLEMQIAEALGIAAHLRFVSLDPFVSGWLAQEPEAEARATAQRAASPAAVERAVPTGGVGGPDEPVWRHDVVWSTASLEGALLATLLEPDLCAPDGHTAGGPEGRPSAPGLAAGDALGPVRAYLDATRSDADGLDRRRAQLARRVAALAFEYSLDRPAMLRAWAQGACVLTDSPAAATERWQQALYRRAQAHLGLPSLAEAVHDALARRLGTGVPSEAGTQETSGPPAVHVFGFSTMARTHLTALVAMAADRDVHVHSLDPCEEFWEDARSDRELRRALRRARSTDPVSDPFGLLGGDDDASLLRAWGRPGREHIALLDELAGFDFESAFVEPGGATLLSRVQASLLHRTAITDGTPDGSLRVVACPSVRREVECLAAHIWSLVEASDPARPLRFHEIGVLLSSADRDLYLPHLEAVFEESHGLPWMSSDLSLSARSRVADCALKLIALPGSEFRRSEVLAVAAHPLVLARWPEAEAAQAAALVERLGVFHGIDDTDHAGTYLERDDEGGSSASGSSASGSSASASPATDRDATAGSAPPVRTAVHWEQAVLRLALGAVMEGEREGRTEPFGLGSLRLHPESFGHTDELAVGLGLLVRSLAADARFARDARMRPSAWSRFFQAMLKSYLVTTRSSEEGELRRCWTALSRLAERDVGVEVSYRIAAELAAVELGSLVGGHGAGAGGGVFVGPLASMRPLPFRALFVLGLGEGSFPARAAETGLDLKLAKREPGDVATDERDRYALLEAILSAREQLVLSYVARDEQSGEAREPSSVLVTLDEALGRALPRERPKLRRHEGLDASVPPVTAWSLPAAVDEARARAVGATYRPALSDARVPEAALQPLPVDDPRRVLLAMPALVPGSAASGSRREGSEEAPERISVSALRSFLECPIQGHAKRVIGGFDDHRPDEQAEDEPFAVAPQERNRVLREVFHAALAEDEEGLVRIYRARVARSGSRGTWPLGALSTIWERKDLALLGGWRAGFARWGAGTPLFSVRLGPGGEPVPSWDRPLDPLALSVGGSRVELSGTTEWLLPDGDLLLVETKDLSETDAKGSAARARIRLRAFLHHAVLSALGPSMEARAILPFRPTTGSTSPGHRRAWVLDAADEGVLSFTFAPMRPDAAERWLEGVIDDLLRGRRGLFMPCEAALGVPEVFTGQSEEPTAALLRSVEQVRTQLEGGSSRYGPVRDAALYPAPPPELALTLAKVRYAAYHDHCRAEERT